MAIPHGCLAGGRHADSGADSPASAPNSLPRVPAPAPSPLSSTLHSRAKGGLAEAAAPHAPGTPTASFTATPAQSARAAAAAAGSEVAAPAGACLVWNVFGDVYCAQGARPYMEDRAVLLLDFRCATAAAAAAPSPRASLSAKQPERNTSSTTGALLSLQSSPRLRQQPHARNGAPVMLRRRVRRPWRRQRRANGVRSGARAVASRCCVLACCMRHGGGSTATCSGGAGGAQLRHGLPPSAVALHQRPLVPQPQPVVH